MANENIYVVGAFNSYQKNLASEMTYQANQGQYMNRILIKQGIYNYQFTSDSPSNSMLEGNHAQTENLYEVLIYFRKPGQRNDSLVGYQKIQFP
jgi:hypothetical protein